MALEVVTDHDVSQAVVRKLSVLEISLASSHHPAFSSTVKQQSRHSGVVGGASCKYFVASRLGAPRLGCGPRHLWAETIVREGDASTPGDYRLPSRLAG